MRRRRHLIMSPLEWQMTAAPVPHPIIPVLAERGGTQLQTPRPTLFVDSREQNPFNFSRFKGWFTGIEKKALTLGDYSVAGLEDVCVVDIFFLIQTGFMTAATKEYARRSRKSCASTTSNQQRISTMRCSGTL